MIAFAVLPLLESGPFVDGRSRREFNKMLRDTDPECYDPRILEQVPASPCAHCPAFFSPGVGIGRPA